MKWDKAFSGAIAVFGSMVNYLWGGWDMALRTLILFMALDYVLGVICGFLGKKLSSDVAFKGILKKVAILVIITVAVSLDNVANTNGVIRSLVLFFYIGLEGISILENASMLGVPIPEKLKEALEQLKEGNKKEIIKEE